MNKIFIIIQITRILQREGVFLEIQDNVDRSRYSVTLNDQHEIFSALFMHLIHFSLLILDMI